VTELKQKLEHKKEKYSIKKKEEQDCIDESKLRLKTDVWQEQSKKECMSKLRQLKDTIDTIKSIERCKRRLEHLEPQIQEESEKVKNSVDTTCLNSFIGYKRCECPNCFKPLLYHVKQHNAQIDLVYNEEVISVMEAVNNSGSTDSSKLKRLMDKKTTLTTDIEELDAKLGNCDCVSQIKSDIATLNEYYETNLTLEKELQKIISDGYPSKELAKKRQEIKQLSRNLKTMKPKSITLSDITLEENDTEESLLAIITEQRIKCSEYNGIKSTIKKLKSKLKDLKHGYDKLMNKLIVSSDSIKAKIDKVETRLSDNQKQCDTIQSELTTIQSYMQYIKEKTEYNDLKNSITEAKTKIKSTDNKIEAVGKLKNMIITAESTVIENIVDILNTQANEYLEVFFRDHPIVIELSAYKVYKNRSTKPQVNLRVEYKETECDVKDLSAGERQRVCLAFELAFADLNPNSIVMLDECLNNLDQETTGYVVEGIREKFRGKQAIIVAHQVVTGLFDRVIEL